MQCAGLRLHPHSRLRPRRHPHHRRSAVNGSHRHRRTQSTARGKPLDKCLFNPFSQQLRVAVCYISRQGDEKKPASWSGKQWKMAKTMHKHKSMHDKSVRAAPQNCQPPVHLAFCIILIGKWHTFKFRPFPSACSHIVRNTAAASHLFVCLYK